MKLSEPNLMLEAARDKERNKIIRSENSVSHLPEDCENHQSSKMNYVTLRAYKEKPGAQKSSQNLFRLFGRVKEQPWIRAKTVHRKRITEQTFALQNGAKKCVEQFHLIPNGTLLCLFL